MTLGNATMKTFALATVVALGVGSAIVLVACGGDETNGAGGGTVPPDAGERPDVAYSGPVRGGGITTVDGSAPAPVEPANVDANVPCCMVMFDLPDLTADEISVRLEGPSPDLQGGLATTHVNGAWHAEKCVAVGTHLLYRFRVERAPDADAGEQSEEDASTLTEYRTRADVPTSLDGDDRVWNVDPSVCVDDDAGSSTADGG
jgi:hypothetical protein